MRHPPVAEVGVRGCSSNGGWLTLRGAAFAQHTKSILDTSNQRWALRPCGSCKGAGFWMSHPTIQFLRLPDQLPY